MVKKILEGEIETQGENRQEMKIYTSWGGSGYTWR